MQRLILNEAHYEEVVKHVLTQTQEFLWIATADAKDLHVQGRKKQTRPFFHALADLVREGKHIRFLHAKNLGPRLQADLDLCPELIDNDLFERGLCPRLHMKALIVDGRWAYLGSANLTGAGLGMKSPHRRNFEAGLVTDEPSLVEPLMEEIDRLWLGHACRLCQRRSLCPDPLDQRWR
jgi:phosphatidylserine/phosphatidylglycerophosphate/cardiolipin synthase-like enzyme